MKVVESSKFSGLRDESELVRQFLTLLAERRILPFRARFDISQRPYDGHIEFTLDDRVLKYTVEFKLKPSVKDVSQLRQRTTSNPPLLVTPDLSDRILDTCKELGISAMDLNGRVWLRAPGIFVERGPTPGRNFRYELEPRNIFVGKSLRIVRTLLTDRDRIWTQPEIALRTKASPGLVSRLTQHLINQGFLEKLSSREFRFEDHQGLLDAWAEADNFARRTNTVRYACFITDFRELADQFQGLAREDRISIAFTQWYAASLRHHWVDVPLVSAYVSHLPTSETLELLDFREVSEGGKFWLHVPDDEGVFLEAQKIDGLQVVSDAQIYVDLQRTGLRGPDAAEALRSWEGFCRP